MPRLASVHLVASGKNRRTSRCTVFDDGKRLVSGAINHAKGDGPFCLYTGNHLVDMAVKTLAASKSMVFTHKDYNYIPTDVEVITSIGVNQHLSACSPQQLDS